MKIKFLLFIAIITSALAQAQDKVFYLDSLYREASESNYQIKRVIKDFDMDKNEYKVFEYNQDEKILLEGTYADKITLKKIGAFTNYYTNGKTKAITNYSEFKPFGKHIEWYENGNVKLEAEYTNAPSDSGKNYKINQFWDENNVQKVIAGNGSFYEKNKKTVTEGLLKNGYKEGEWKQYNSDFHQILEIYSEGKFISGTNTDRDGNVVNYVELERRPEPVDGMAHFYKYIANNFNFTREAIKNNITGKIFVQFVVDKEGKITEAKILKGLGYGLDEEAIRVVSSYKNWIPGMQKGRKVRCSYAIPISLSGYR